MTGPEPPDVARLRRALRSLAGRPGAEPVDAPRIFAALHGEVDPEERRAVVEELVRNPEAAAAWRLARELAPEPASRDAPAGGWRRPAGRRHRPAWTWASLAAAGVAALALGAQLGPWRSFQEPTYRSLDGRRIQSRVRSDTPLPRAGAVLRWTAVGGARYRVRVLTPDLELLEEAEDIGAAEYRLGPDVVARLPAGGRFLWQVEASSPGAAPLVSPTFSSRLE
jgi:hypothetical protein